MRVPICTPSAPSTNAAAIERPSQTPPAAMIGTSTCDAMSGSSTIVDAPVGRLEAAAFVAFDDQPVDPGVDRLQRAPQRRHDVEDGEPRVLERTRELGRVAGRGRDERDAVLGDEVDDRRIADEQLRDVHAERLVGELAHLDDLVAHLVEPARTTSR